MFRFAALPLALLVALPASASANDDLSSQLPEVLGFAGGGTIDAPRPARVLIPPVEADETEPLHAPGGVAIIIFMNRLGATYTPGNNDARTNGSSIPNGTSTIAPWNVSDAGWQATMTAMQEIWAPYNVVITDVDPGNVPHYESVMAGYPQDVGMPQGVLGVSPYTLDCGIIPNSVAFTFADYAVDVLGPNYQEIAEIASQEVAHSFGLDHQLLASDPMTYLPYAGNRSFSDSNTNCGEDNPRPCGLDAGNPCTNLGVPGSTTQQNSHQTLLQRVGPRGDDLSPPTVTITSPANGATVNPGFNVASTATAAGGATVANVVLFIDGTIVGELTTSPFTFNTPTDIAPGQHTVMTRVTDSNGASTDAQIAVVVPSSDPDDPGNPGDPGDPNDPDDPVGAAPGGDLVGGCSASTGSSGSLASLLLLGLVFGLRRRRND